MRVRRAGNRLSVPGEPALCSYSSSVRLVQNYASLPCHYACAMDVPRRRKQYSSCDRCRSSRVACDAARRRAGRNRSCSRCLRTKAECTFNWIAASPRAPARRSTHRASTDRQASPGAGDTHSSSHCDFWPDALWVSTALQNTFLRCFNRVFSSWVAHCPGASNDPSDSSSAPNAVSFLSICVELDECMRRSSEIQGQSPAGPRVFDDDDPDINHALVAAVHCFAARWLPVLNHDFLGHPLCEWHEMLVRQLWRTARKRMLKAINQRSYRCILALFLFGLTPIPSGIDDNEESDGLSGQLCIQIALRKIYELRSRQRTFQFSGFKVVPSTAAVMSPGPEGDTSDFVIGAENLVYYAGVIFDTSASLTLSCRSSLTAGLLGSEQELIFQLISASANLFHDQRTEKQQRAIKISEADAASIISHTGEWKMYTWKMIATFKEALRDGYSDETIDRAYNAVLRAIDRFNVTNRPQMEECQRMLEFMSSTVKFDWYLIMLHWHLGILILMDGIEASGRLDLISKPESIWTDSVHGAVNTLKFGSANSISMTGGAPGEHTHCSFLSIDPYPHHVVAAAQLLSKAIVRDHEKGNIGDEAFRNLTDIIATAMDQLPNTSSSVQMARGRIHSTADTGTAPLHALPLPNAGDVAANGIVAASDSTLTHTRGDMADYIAAIHAASSNLFESNTTA